MKDQIVALLTSILADMSISGAGVVADVPEDSSHGDYTTNVAFRLAKDLKKSPMEIALQVVEEVKRKKENGKRVVLDQNIKQKDQSGSAGIVENSVLQDIERIEVAPLGFINIFLTKAKLITLLRSVLEEKESYGTIRHPTSDIRHPKVMVEYAHPNTHKAFHIGHLRNITTGESIVRLLESQGHEVIRANYQGDVGMHIAKCLYGILQVQSSKFKVQNWKEVTKLIIKDRIEYLGEMYSAGSKAFEEDPKAKEMIKDINFLVYASAQRLSEVKGAMRSSTDYLTFVHGRQAELDEVYALWKETRQWSLDYFATIYKRVGTDFDRYYFEGECLGGVDRANEAVEMGVLKKSEGAIVFDGKSYGIDTRVFVNSMGLPTYEAKELALSAMETSEFGTLDRIVHVVGPEQASFFKVTFKAEELLGIVKPGVQKHLIYGWVKLKHGKMSSRSGVVVLGEWLLDEVKKAVYDILQKSQSKTLSNYKYQNQNDTKKVKPFEAKYSREEVEEIAEKSAVAAVKYSFLRVSTTNEIAFDLKESVNMEGDSGPYLLYTYARCQSVIRKAHDNAEKDLRELKQRLGNFSFTIDHLALNREEREVARLLLYFPDVVKQAAKDYAPSSLCTYLFHLAQAFNLFYAKHSILNEVVKGKRKTEKGNNDSTLEILKNITVQRLAITAATAQVLKNGLYLLGIETLEQM